MSDKKDTETTPNVSGSIQEQPEDKGTRSGAVETSLPQTEGLDKKK